MSRVKDAICWDGVYATLWMYVVYDLAPDVKECSFEFGAVTPIQPVKPFVLVDEAGTFAGRTLAYYEIRLTNIPDNLQEYLGFCVRAAIQKGATFTWFAFEGAFDFDHILTEDVANQVYCVCGSDRCVSVALDDSLLLSDEWKAFISDKRQGLIS